MTQDNYIFSGTIRENIMYGKLDATEEEIVPLIEPLKVLIEKIKAKISE